MSVVKANSRNVPYILAGLGGIVCLVRGISALLPAARAMMLDVGASFLLNFIVTGALFWAAYQSMHAARAFWRWLAWAWTLNILGNLAWAAYDFWVGQSLAILSWIDGFYIARYALVFWAFWRYPTRRWRTRWVAYGALLASATAVTWAMLFRPVMSTVSQPLLYFFGGALYPILDTVLVYGGLMCWTYTADARMHTATQWLVLSMTAYGVANWINFGARVVSLDAASQVAGLFWLLADVGTGVAALYAAWPAKLDAHMQPQTAPRVPALVWLPYLAGCLTLVVMGGDWIIRGSVDPMLLGCAGGALFTLGYRGLFFRREKDDRSEP